MAYAIMEIEGWLSPFHTKTGNGSRSYRNHNPGNLRGSPFAIGVIENYAVFNTDFDGMEALKWDIRQKAKGNSSTGLNGMSTLADFVRVWAPQADNNNPTSYIKQLCTLTGFTPEMRLRDLL